MKQWVPILWLVLSIGFFLEGADYLYRTIIERNSGELLIGKISGFAFLGFPLATLCLSIYFLQRGTRLSVLPMRIIWVVAGSLGLFFLGAGLYNIFVAWPEPEQSLQPISLLLSALGFVGYPLSILSIAYRYMKHTSVLTNPRAQVSPFFICIGLHILQFLVWWFWPFSEMFRYGGASLAFLFGAANFSHLTSSADHRP